MSFEEYAADRRRALFRFAVVLCGDPVLAEDIVQNVLGRAFEQWDRVGRANDVHAYIRRMVVNEYLSWRRRLSRSTPHGNITDLAESIPDHAAGHAERHALLAELSKLPRRQRAAVVLRFYEGMPDAEIAALLGCGQSAVRSYVSRGLTALRIEMSMERPNADALSMFPREI
jgi:RNA polymerase sigma-70 factor (sigma-E family)